MSHPIPSSKVLFAFYLMFGVFLQIWRLRVVSYFVTLLKNDSVTGSRQFSVNLTTQFTSPKAVRPSILSVLDMTESWPVKATLIGYASTTKKDH